MTSLYLGQTHAKCKLDERYNKNVRETNDDQSGSETGPATKLIEITTRLKKCSFVVWSILLARTFVNEVVLSFYRYIFINRSKIAKTFLIIVKLIGRLACWVQGPTSHGNRFWISALLRTEWNGSNRNISFVHQSDRWFLLGGKYFDVWREWWIRLSYQQWYWWVGAATILTFVKDETEDPYCRQLTKSVNKYDSLNFHDQFSILRISTRIDRPTQNIILTSLRIAVFNTEKISTILSYNKGKKIPTRRGDPNFRMTWQMKFLLLWEIVGHAKTILKIRCLKASITIAAREAGTSFRNEHTSTSAKDKYWW